MIKETSHGSFFRRFFASSLAFFLLASLPLGCGRKGAPIPDRSIDSFSFGSTVGELSSGGLLTLKGSIEGAAANLECIILEVQPVTGELCEGCPFLPVDQKRFDSSEVALQEDIRSFDISYRPFMAADAYRWRLSGVNIHSGIPPVQTEVRTAGSLPAHREIPVPVMGTDELGEILAREKSISDPRR